ncbi:hypothetical protein [Mycolicibacterium canariasense]|uniref:hypothetical protein n=1 Tax=Mycolicibacterium canariasense TaxID=228230 RepID=UPI000789271C|nr:hypothetical protein [Mycolicibacterium canariasense]ORU97865.1 hypothetical protein AWB94_29370 [Mycolicibacterium canariasense]
MQYPATDQVFSGTELSVHWSSHDDLVQLGLTRHVWGRIDPDADVSPVHADHSHCSSCAAAVEQNKIRRAEQEKSGVLSGMVGFTGSDAPPVGEFDDPATVFTEPMRRSEINQLIRVLRRARDQAFGKDE